MLCCASDAVTMVAYVGRCVGSGTGEGGEVFVKGASPDGGRVIAALFFSRILFSFFEATSVHCVSDAVTMVPYVGCCIGSGTGGGGVIVCK